MTEELRPIVRIISSDIPGGKQVYDALTKVSGVSYSLSSAICNIMNINKYKKVGSLSQEEVKKIEDIIKNPVKYKLPSYLLNRRRDPDTGQDIQLIAADLKLTREFDIKKLKRIRTYRGIRHALGLPVRGQKTRSHFRKGRSVGVQKKKIAAQKAAASKEDKKEGKK
ncbi:30S ribosomal protein S13 [Candidatus Woesearchaeota archaeon]|nr:30S ribosomal protein S13 [Candidatus Woesearchaeota archaeon]